MHLLQGVKSGERSLLPFWLIIAGLDWLSHTHTNKQAGIHSTHTHKVFAHKQCVCGGEWISGRQQDPTWGSKSVVLEVEVLLLGGVA